ncbi:MULTISPECIES: hypothetical protein [Pseudomonas]
MVTSVILNNVPHRVGRNHLAVARRFCGAPLQIFFEERADELG